MSVAVRPLVEVLREVPDPRTARGRRYTLVSILMLVSVATLCGYSSYGAMALWIKDYGEEWLPKLGFDRGRTPCVGALHNVLTRLDVVALERVLGEWAHSVLDATAAPACASVVAIDGKTLRSSAKQGAPGTHLLSAVSPVIGVTLCQKAVPKKSNEIGAIHEVLETLVLEGRIVTVDALLTQRAVARTVVEKKGTT